MLDIVNNTAEANVTETKVLDGVELVLSSATEKEIATKQKKQKAKDELSIAKDIAKKSKESVDNLTALVPSYSQYNELQSKANDALYALLESMMTVVLSVKGFRSSLADGKARKRFDDAFDNELNNANVDFTDATSFERKIVRFVIRPNSNDAKQIAISASREKSWARVLVQAQKQKDIVSGELKLSSLLYACGGVSVLSSVDSSGKSAAQRSNEQQKKANTFVSTHLAKQSIRPDVVSNSVIDVNSKIKNDNDAFKRYSVTLNFAGNEVMTLRDDAAIGRLLDIIGASIANKKMSAKAYHDTLAKTAELKTKSESKSETQSSQANNAAQKKNEDILNEIRSRKQ